MVLTGSFVRPFFFLTQSSPSQCCFASATCNIRMLTVDCLSSPPQSTITIEAGGTTRTFTTKSRTSSGGSASIRSHPSNGSGGSGYSGGSGSTESESWSVLERDEIEPEDSASRARQPSSRRYTTEARPAPTRRHSSRRIREPEEEPPRRHRSTHRQHSSRSRRVDSHRAPSDDSSLGTVASYPDDYPQGHHGMPPPRGYPYPNGVRHVPTPGHGGYPPSIVTSGAGYPEGYNSRGAMVHLPQQDPFGYPVNGANPFGTQDPQSESILTYECCLWINKLFRHGSSCTTNATFIIDHLLRNDHRASSGRQARIMARM